ncbi:nucleolar and spindle-associated protein 1 isoform X1 [Corythoichthys intestinalis]|uniref:nucleolar and spindle-associated protein 1 isoform X1 n=1 Tax=Corythoichthys intestinalis TaxID=161448 RepID=UPI0025A5E106|nr:nucleolar and spindle-associated protein 1 isoform X1 [Corythoichthys intestinalis]
MDLDSLKYADLRSLAKQLGLKGNMKAPKLLNAIKKHYEQQKDSEKEKVEEIETNITTEMQAEDSSKVSATPVFVNTRRGKVKNKSKRSESDVKWDDEVVSEMVPLVHTHKKRRVSPRSKTEKKEDNEPLVKSSNKDEAGTVPCVAKAGKIPRYIGKQEKRTALKPVTPNFQKLHKAHFDKMESIDAYLQRKNNNKKMGPVQEGKVTKTSRVALFSPAPYRRKNEADSQNKMADKSKEAVFNPTVLSTRRINVRFSEAMPDNEYKRSLVKTPARMSQALATSTPNKPAAEGRKSALSTTTPSAAFVFTGNTSVTPGTQKKAVFDLKASLARPLSYKPHTGKLKPLGDDKDKKAINSALLIESRKKNYKQHRVQTREERLLKQAEERQAKKSNLLFARRGLVMN